MSDVYEDVNNERERAHQKHDAGGNSMERKGAGDVAWLPVLAEEFGEVARALCEFMQGNVSLPVHLSELREELVQVAAMTCAWIDAIDRSL